MKRHLKLLGGRILTKGHVYLNIQGFLNNRFTVFCVFCTRYYVEKVYVTTADFKKASKKRNWRAKRVVRTCEVLLKCSQTQISFYPFFGVLNHFLTLLAQTRGSKSYYTPI